MLDAGAAVTVVAEPDGPADEGRVGMAAGEGDMALEDAQIRAGATFELAVDDWKLGPSYPHSRVAVTPGRTAVALTITADSKPVVVGTVTVIVD